MGTGTEIVGFILIWIVIQISTCINAINLLNHHKNTCYLQIRIKNIKLIQNYF